LWLEGRFKVTRTADVTNALHSAATLDQPPPASPASGSGLVNPPSGMQSSARANPQSAAGQAPASPSR
jgi:hypothetical protein